MDFGWWILDKIEISNPPTTPTMPAFASSSPRLHSTFGGQDWNHCDDFNWVNKDVIALK